MVMSIVLRLLWVVVGGVLLVLMVLRNVVFLFSYCL